MNVTEQCGIAAVYVWIPTWRVPNIGSSAVPQYGVMEDFEQSAQEPTVCCNIQPAAQPTGFSDFQLNDSNSSSLQWQLLTFPLPSLMNYCHPQSTVATSDIPTAFPHEPLPPTSATPIDSTGWNLKAVSLSSQLSILKQGTSDTRSTPRSAKIIRFSVNNTELEKKTGIWPTDTGKKLSCRKSHCEKHRMQQKENGRKGTFCRKIKPIKPVMKTGRSGLKSPIWHALVVRSFGKGPWVLQLQ